MTQRVAQQAGLAPRLVAIERLEQVLGGARFDPFTAAEITDSRDRALANRLVTTALRRHGHLDVVIAALLDRGLPKKSGSFEAVLRLSLAQLLFLPELGAHSALFLGGEALKRDGRARHLGGLLNAVLRRAQAEPERWASLPLRLLFPARLADAWQAQYGAVALDAFGTALLEGAPLDLTLRDDDAGLVTALDATPLAAGSVRVASRDRSVADLPGFAEGRWWVQDIAASLPARLIGLPAGARVLDLCAAPGGKTAQLIAAGHAVTALDADAARMQRLTANLGRLGLAAETVIADAARYEPTTPFDAVLLDAPCSATGTFRRHPEVIWHRSLADVAGRARLQRQMLEQAARCLAPGGVLVYCVCSLEAAEGEAQAAFVRASLPGLSLEPIGAEELAPIGGVVAETGTMRTHPGIDPGGVAGGMDGFFAMRLRKQG